MRMRQLNPFGLLWLTPVVALSSCPAAGCRAPGVFGDPSQGAVPGLPAEYGNVVGKLADMVTDQGVLDEFIGRAEGDFFDPGLAAFVETRIGVRFVGTQGEVDLSAQGTGTQLPAGVRESLIAQLGGPISDAQRESILTILGWNRVPSEHNPPPNVGGFGGGGGG